MSTATTTEPTTSPNQSPRSTTQPTNTPVTQTTPNAAQRLRTTMAAVRLAFTCPSDCGVFSPTDPRPSQPLTGVGHEASKPR